MLKDKKTSRLERSETMKKDEEQAEIKKNKKELKVAECLKEILINHITPNSKFLMRIDEWRIKNLWTNDVNRVLEPRLDRLALLYKSLLELNGGEHAFILKSAIRFTAKL